MITSDIQLLEEVQALRATVAALTATLEAQHRVSLSCQLNQPLLLGQSIPLTVTVTDLTGSPRIGVMVTLVATWGNLQSFDSFTVQQGSSVTVRTDVQGKAIVMLLPPTREALQPDQQAALEVQLRSLDANADTPQLLVPALQEIARQYRWEINTTLQQAIDIYFQNFGASLIDGINSENFLEQWLIYSTTVIAYAQATDIADLDQSLGTSIQGTAALQLSVKDWLRPWLQVYQQLLQTESNLDTDLQTIKDQTRRTGSLLETLYSQAHDYVNGQTGRVGEYIGRRVVERSLNDFLSIGMSDLPAETQFAVGSALKVASRAIATTGTSGLANIAQTRFTMRQEVDTKLGQIDLSGLTSRLSELETSFTGISQNIGGLTSRLSGLESSVTQVGGNMGTLTNRIGTLETNFSTVNTNVGNLSNRLGTLETNQARIDNNVGTLTGRVGTLETNQTRFDNNLGGLTGRIGTLETNQTRFENNLGTFTNRIGTLETNQTRFNNTLGDLTGRIGTVETTVSNVSKSVSTVVDRFSSLETGLTLVNGTVGRLSNQVGTLEASLTTTNRAVSTLGDRVGGLETNVTRIDRNLGTVIGRIGTLETNVTRVDNNLGALTGRVGGLETSFTRIDTNLGTIVGRIGNLETGVTRIDTNLGNLTGQIGGLESNFTRIDTNLGNLTGRIGDLETNVGRIGRISGSRITGLEDSITRIGNNVLALRTDLMQNL